MEKNENILRIIYKNKQMICIFIYFRMTFLCIIQHQQSNACSMSTVESLTSLSFLRVAAGKCIHKANAMAAAACAALPNLCCKAHPYHPVPYSLSILSHPVFLPIHSIVYLLSQQFIAPMEIIEFFWPLNFQVKLKRKKKNFIFKRKNSMFDKAVDF